MRLITTLFLSLIAGAGVAHGSQSTVLDGASPITGSVRVGVCVCNPSQDAWEKPGNPVPYKEPWENDLNQTAQQMVGIVALLQSEGLTKEEIGLFLEWYRVRGR